MNWETITIDKAAETVYFGVHPTGLPMYVLPKKGFSSAYAVIGTRYGSVDNDFAVDGEQLHVPAGIAHYLEHKLFEDEDGDAFQKYAKTGASANAYTGFMQTAYLFSCTEKVAESLEILLKFVQNPYFTDATVEKERGIIGQEIRMGEDNPDRLSLFQMLRCMYQNHPVREDIAGTVESIAQITPELLYKCYRTFYNLHNMALVVSGNIDVKTVETVADRVLKPAPPFTLERTPVEEPAAVCETRVEATMPIAAPLFYIGFKEPVTAGYVHTSEQLVAAELLLELLAGSGSPLYTQLMEEGLINETFDGAYFEGAGYAAFLFSGESNDPDRIADLLTAEIDRLKRDGIDKDLFEEEKKAFYGRLIAGLNDVESCGDWLLDDCMYGRKPFALIDSVAALDVQSVEQVLHHCLLTDNKVISIVNAQEEQ